MASLSSASDAGAGRAPDLTRLRRVATGILLALVAVLVATHLVDEPSPAVLLIRSMAEAGMVGGIADWFAVEALFRHPLGIPIPHTALLPKNQQRAARNVGRFFHDNFLQPDQIRERLADLHPARRAAEWLGDRHHAALVGRHLTSALGYGLQRTLPRKLTAKMRAEMRAILSSPDADRAMADTIAPLLKDGLSEEVVSDVLLRLRRAIDENRGKVIEIVQERSRWWIASTVDRRIATTIVDGVLSVMDDLTDTGSPLRGEFEAAFGRMVDALAEDGALSKAVGQGRGRFVASGGFDAMAGALGSALHARLSGEIEDHPDRVAALLADTIRKVAAQILDDEATLANFEERLGQAAGQIVAEMRGPLAAYVTDVIAGWDPQVFSERFESEIGPDLQYIRINGAVLGSLIGGLIFGVEALLG